MSTRKMPRVSDGPILLQLLTGVLYTPPPSILMVGSLFFLSPSLLLSSPSVLGHSPLPFPRLPKEPYILVLRLPLRIFTASISIHSDSISIKLRQRYLDFPGLFLLHFCLCKAGMESSALHMLSKRSTTEQMVKLCCSCVHFSSP